MLTTVTLLFSILKRAIINCISWSQVPVDVSSGFVEMGVAPRSISNTFSFFKNTIVVSRIQNWNEDHKLRTKCKTFTWTRNDEQTHLVHDGSNGCSKGHNSIGDIHPQLDSSLHLFVKCYLHVIHAVRPVLTINPRGYVSLRNHGTYGVQPKVLYKSWTSFNDQFLKLII